MMERAKFPDEKIFIPLLESEIVDSNLTSLFLTRLEKLYKEEALARHLETKSSMKKSESLQEDESPVDCETLRRK